MNNRRFAVSSFALALFAPALFALAFVSLAHGAVKNVVPVHGAFADGSGWKAVANILQHDGYTVSVVQEPETTFQADLSATRLVLDRSGPCVLVGHSYGGMSGRAKSQAIELQGSHAIFLSHPKEVASLIERAAKSTE